MIPNDVDITTKIIEVTLILFILSMVTEKISNFIKTLGAKRFYQRLAKNPDEENRRSIQFQIVTIIVGIFVAFISKVNLINIYNEHQINIFWKNNDVLLTFQTISGLFLTGVFLSLGSKFWHDLLGILFEIKKAKRKIGQKDQWDFSSIEYAEHYLNEDETEEINKYLDSYFKLFPEVEDYFLNQNTQSVRVISKTYLTELPKRIVYKSKSGIQLILSVEIEMI